jgi:ELWxxDGT repeat protein
LLAGFAIALGLSGCGSSSSETTSNYSTAVSTAPLAASNACPNGGQTISTGIDKNGNGILDADEVTNTYPICNGAPGAQGAPGTVSTDAPCALVVTVDGLEGSGLVLQNNGLDDLTVSANGRYAFATTPAAGDSYDVTIKWQPSAGGRGNLTACGIQAGTGTVASTVTEVAVTCASYLLFPATDAAHGDELWITEGTNAGTHLVKDIYEGTSSSNVSISVSVPAAPLFMKGQAEC